MQAMSFIHLAVSVYSVSEFLGTVIHLPLLSVCSRYAESTLVLFMTANLLLTAIFYINFKQAAGVETNVLKRSRVFFFFLIITSPVFLLTPLLPGVFCPFSDFTKGMMTKAVSSFLMVLLESFMATIYFIRYDRYVIHKELYPTRGIDTSLKL
jgi:hypothetical protein